MDFELFPWTTNVVSSQRKSQSLNTLTESIYQAYQIVRWSCDYNVEFTLKTSMKSVSYFTLFSKSKVLYNKWLITSFFLVFHYADLCIHPDRSGMSIHIHPQIQPPLPTSLQTNSEILSWEPILFTPLFISNLLILIVHQL